jgi:predicted alpha/beta-hydrolase family hydrolase
MSQPTSTAPLTVVLVHGAFADSSSPAGVIERLQANGVQVVAAANPLRGISIDSPTSPACSAKSPDGSLRSGTPTAAR